MWLPLDTHASATLQRKLAAEHAQMTAAAQAATSGQHSFAGPASLQHGQARSIPPHKAYPCHLAHLRRVHGLRLNAFGSVFLFVLFIQYSRLAERPH